MNFSHRRVHRQLVMLAVVPLFISVLLSGIIASTIYMGVFARYEQLVVGPLWLWVGESIDLRGTQRLSVDRENMGDYVGVKLSVPLAEEGHYRVTVLLIKRIP